jgi:hypothetical protein
MDAAALAAFRRAWSIGGEARRQQCLGQKSDPTKLALAARLRQDTTLSVRQIAERLRLGKPKGARTNRHKFMNRSGAGGSRPQFDSRCAMKTTGLFYGLTPPTTLVAFMAP